jgi:hypothetical protein
MRLPSKTTCTIGMLVALALTASAADARRLDTTRFGSARDSVSTRSAPSTPGGVSYGAEIAPYPTGHGGNGSSPDFQMIK